MRIVSFITNKNGSHDVVLEGPEGGKVGAYGIRRVPFTKATRGAALESSFEEWQAFADNGEEGFERL